MPTAVGPNTKGEENLVFGYDLGDTRNSYRGEPTTNLAGTDAARTIGFHNQGAYGNAGSVSDAPEKGPGWKKITITNRGNNFRIAQFPYTTLSSGITYSYSLEVDMGTTSGYYWRIDGSGGYGAITVQNNRVVTTITPSAGVYAIFLNHNTTGVSGINEVIYYRYYQVEQNSHATQFAEGTRSATQGLLDLTGNSTINLTNVSFDSNAQMTFDGTDDNLDADLQLNYGNFSVEMIASWNSVSDLFCAGSGAAGDGLTGGTYFNAHMTTSGFYVRAYSPPGGPGGWNNSSTVSSPSSTNTTYHITVVNIGTVWYFYKNGTLAGSVDALYTPNSASTRVGIFRNHVQTVGNAGEVFSFKAYNRALTASEVQSNYNAIKGRFNI